MYKKIVDKQHNICYTFINYLESAFFFALSKMGRHIQRQATVFLRYPVKQGVSWYFFEHHCCGQQDFSRMVRKSCVQAPCKNLNLEHGTE